MVDLKDPTRDAILRELRAFRKIAGEPAAYRMDGLAYLTDILGEGIPGRAFEELMRLRADYGSDPRTTIGTYFYLAGYGIGKETIDQRRFAYQEQYGAEISTSWRRAERGMRELAELIRDRDERSRPWALVSLFQSGNSFQPFLDFNFGLESWRPPEVLIDGEEVELEFHVHRDATGNGVTRRIVLPERRLDLSVIFGQPMAALRVIWSMPVWPVWNLVSWTADPRILTRLRTFRQRAVEVSLEWWQHTDASDGLVSDGAIWAERETSHMNLPPGWRVERRQPPAQETAQPADADAVFDSEP